MVESLAAETEPFGLRTLLLEPGRFRTEISSSEKLGRSEVSQIPEYRQLSKFVLEYLADLHGKQQGDPAKLVDITVDLVRGEGVAVGKQLPLRLPIGQDSLDAVKGKMEEVRKSIEEWEEVTISTDFEV